MGEVFSEYLGECWGYVGVTVRYVRDMFGVSLGYSMSMLEECWGQVEGMLDIGLDTFGVCYEYSRSIMGIHCKHFIMWLK